ncbi:Cloroperoxidase [Ceratobasidium sp. AG-I]|nr:Cloroperoxidase [Ceratobasidium sp. AG-I]
MDTRPGHAFQSPSSGDSRSPCPALNAAANHGYLPHSGRNLTAFQLIRSIHELYGLSYPLAILLTIGGILTCGRWGTLDLESLSKHGRIEHDASLVHLDARDGDNNNVCPHLVSELLAQSSDGRGLSWGDYARARARREQTISKPLDSMHGNISRGESVLSVMVMGDGNEVPLGVAKTWYGEEKLPAGWMPRGTLVRRRHGGH